MRPDRDRFQALVGAGLSTLISVLSGMQIQAAGGQRWTPTGGTPLSVWLTKLAPADRLRVVRDLAYADTEMLTAQILRQCVPPALRKVLSGVAPCLGKPPRSPSSERVGSS
jgi:hypothetical protein